MENARNTLQEAVQYFVNYENCRAFMAGGRYLTTWPTTDPHESGGGLPFRSLFMKRWGWFSLAAFALSVPTFNPPKALAHVNLTPVPSFYYVTIAWVTQEAAVCATHRNTNKNTRSNG